MTPHVLDRPALAALQSRHRHHAEALGRALRYDPDVAPFVSAPGDDAEALADIGRLVPEDRFAIMLQVEESPLPPGTVAEMRVDGVQMVAENLAPPAGDIAFVELTEADVPAMVALAALTRPGPFLTKTHRFGGYIGIKLDGRLAAMAGKRFQVPGFAEVSAVCTHPDARGRGYAGFLTATVAARIAARGETPFLHTFAQNTGAIRLYEKLGFVLRTGVKVLVLRRA